MFAPTDTKRSVPPHSYTLTSEKSLGFRSNKVKDSIPMPLRTSPLGPLILVNARLPDHRLERFHWITAVGEVDFDNPMRLAIIATFDPQLV